MGGGLDRPSSDTYLHPPWRRPPSSPFAHSPDHPGRYPADNGAGGDILSHHGIRSHNCTISNVHSTDNYSASHDLHVVSDRGVLSSACPECDPVKDLTVGTDDDIRVDDHAPCDVAQEKTGTDDGGVGKEQTVEVRVPGVEDPTGHPERKARTTPQREVAEPYDHLESGNGTAHEDPSENACRYTVGVRSNEPSALPPVHSLKGIQLGQVTSTHVARK